MRPYHLIPPEKTDRATSASLGNQKTHQLYFHFYVENLTQNTDELEDLRRQNQFLEEEVARLKLLLRDKDRAEHELRRLINS